MLTVDFGRLGLRPGDRVLDLGCGAGRHAFEAGRRGARVVALDADAAGLKDVRAVLDELDVDGSCVNGDALVLPFPDAAFDRVVAAEVLEHVLADDLALAELSRVLRPGGTMAVTVPRWWPERVCWALSEEYHAPAVERGHVRVYRSRQLHRRLHGAGLTVLGSQHVHALHSPYWWLRCAVDPRRPPEDSLATRVWHRLLVWDITARPRVTRVVERVLDPVIGKSLVVYTRKPRARA